MARRMFAVVDVVELLRHWQAGDSVSQMARALGLDRKTVRKYAGRAAEAGMAPGGAPLSQAEWATRVHAWFPELTDPRARSSAFGQIAPFHEYIKEHLPETTLATIHQRLRDEHGLAVSVASLRRYVRSELAEEVAEERATVLRDDPRRARRRNSTTATSADGSTPRAAPCAASGPSSWCSPTHGTSSATPCCA